jgi:hypothetical protein
VPLGEPRPVVLGPPRKGRPRCAHRRVEQCGDCPTTVEGRPSPRDASDGDQHRAPHPIDRSWVELYDSNHPRGSAIMLEVRIERDIIEFDGFCHVRESVAQHIYLPKHRLLKHFEDTGNLSMYDEAWYVPDVCKSPAGIWQGLDRTDQEEAYCYAGVPSGEFSIAHGMAFAFPNDHTLMVFLTRGFEVTKWRKCKEAADRPGFPFDHQKRFGGRLWPKD